MKFILEVNNKTTQKFSKKKILGIFQRSLELVNENRFKGKAVELSVAMVGEKEIQDLNFKYRKKNRPTDVLSFSERETIDDLFKKDVQFEEENIFIGELILCPKYISRNADEDGESFEYALTYIIAHGILHLLGYLHGKKMFSLQKAVADQLAG